MRALFNFIIEPSEGRYNNKVDVEGKELIVNTEITERDFEFVSRIGKVIATPLLERTEIQKGDLVVVHHNVFRRWYDQGGRERNSSSYLDENRYRVYKDQVFAYSRDDKWKATEDFVFVAPIANQDPWRVEVEFPLKGKLLYGPKELVGETVGFCPDSEYEFNIDGQKLYRVLKSNLTWTKKEDLNGSSIRHTKV